MFLIMSVWVEIVLRNTSFSHVPVIEIKVKSGSQGSCLEKGQIKPRVS